MTGEYKHPNVTPSTQEEWVQYVIDHADYFTVVWFRPLGHSERHEVRTLDEATMLAEQLVQAHPDRHYLIYGVAGQHDTWIKTVSRGSTGTQ